MRERERDKNLGTGLLCQPGFSPHDFELERNFTKKGMGNWKSARKIERGKERPSLFFGFCHIICTCILWYIYILYTYICMYVSMYVYVYVYVGVCVHIYSYVYVYGNAHVRERIHGMVLTAQQPTWQRGRRPRAKAPPSASLLACLSEIWRTVMIKLYCS